jgi:outer membrane protein OmpA-like peptidoglycan-associated protein
MSPKWMLGIAALVVPTGLTAQAQVLEEKSADDIACELSGTCANIDATAESTDDADAPSRGWSLGTRARPATTTVATSAAAPARPRVRPVGMAASGNAVRTGARARVQAPRLPGRTTLGITFDRGSSALVGPAQNQADKLFDALKSPSLAKYHYLIGGHTDSAGNRELNLDLSRRRAQAVVDYLVQKGLPREQFRVRGYADEKPLLGLAASASANRRVDVVKLD